MNTQSTGLFQRFKDKKKDKNQKDGNQNESNQNGKFKILNKVYKRFKSNIQHAIISVVNLAQRD